MENQEPQFSDRDRIFILVCILVFVVMCVAVFLLNIDKMLPGMTNMNILWHNFMSDFGKFTSFQ